MRRLYRAIAILMLFGVAAWASIPGATPGKNAEGLLHACVDHEPGHPEYIVCDDQIGGQRDAPYTGAECTAAGLPPVCVIDFVDGARARGLLTLVSDETATGARATATFRFRAGGVRHILADTFADDVLGNWNGITSILGEAAVFEQVPFEVAPHEYQYMTGNLGPMADEITAIVDAARPAVDLSGAVPVFVDMVPNPDSLESDQSGFDEPLASVGRHRIELHFARLRP